MNALRFIQPLVSVRSKALTDSEMISFLKAFLGMRCRRLDFSDSSYKNVQMKSYV